MAVRDLLLGSHHIRVRRRLINSHRLVADGHRRRLPSGSAPARGAGLVGRISAQLGHLNSLWLPSGIARPANGIAARFRILRSARLPSAASLLGTTVLHRDGSRSALASTLLALWSALLAATTRLTALLAATTLLAALLTVSAALLATTLLALRSTLLTLGTALLTLRAALLALRAIWILLTAGLAVFHVFVTRQFKVTDHAIFGLLFGRLAGTIQQQRIRQWPLRGAAAGRGLTRRGRWSDDSRRGGLRSPAQARGQKNAAGQSNAPTNRQGCHGGQD